MSYGPFCTRGYRGGYIHYSTVNRAETIQAQHMLPDGGFILRVCRSTHAAKCWLTRTAREK